ncbi:hypothetical protein [Caudoviricetes sp.]|nr:hypothetical protein [Caudoviricetes sp.]
MKLAIIGSRDYLDLEYVRTFVGFLPANVVVVTGGARGVDSAAESAARERGLAVEIHLPDYERFGRRGAPMRRNADIVSSANAVLAFWDGKSSGTQKALAMAEKAGKPNFTLGYQSTASDAADVLRVIFRLAS